MKGKIWNNNSHLEKGKYKNTHLSPESSKKIITIKNWVGAALIAILLWWWYYNYNNKEGKDKTTDQRQIVVWEWQTFWWIVRDSIISWNMDLTDEQKTDWSLCKKIIDEIAIENNIDSIDHIWLWDTLVIDNDKINSIISEYLKEQNAMDDNWEGFKVTEATEQQKNAWYVILHSLEEFEKCADNSVKKIYKDINIWPRIERALKDWYTVRIPKAMENANSKRYTIDEITKPDEIIDDSLKWKKFMIDPWHWINDPWSIGLAQFWPEEDKAKVLVLEAPVSLDIAYRVAKILRSHWAKVDFTHYNPARWISDVIDLPQNFSIWDTYQDLWDDSWESTKMETPVTQKESLRRRAKIANKYKSTALISIHADFIPTGKIWTVSRNWKNYKYLIPDEEKKEVLVKYDLRWSNWWASKKLAEWMIKDDSWFWFYKKEWDNKVFRLKSYEHKAENQPLYVLNNIKTPWVLVETWNISQPNQAFFLRWWDKRQEFAEWLAESIIKYYK